MSGAAPQLVSCILPTCDRADFFPQALRCFLRQTYTPKELIVVDDGGQPVEHVCAGIDCVRYVRLGRVTPTGTKLNIGIEHARGDILQKLDDDDYYHPGFLRTAVATLSSRTPAALITWDCFLILMAGESRARYTGHGWTAGGTLCFPRRVWESSPFRDVAADEDWWFLNDHSSEIATVCAPEQYMLVRHGRNTWAHEEAGPVDDRLRQLPFYPKPLECVVDRHDLEFYRSLHFPAQKCRLEGETTPRSWLRKAPLTAQDLEAEPRPKGAVQAAQNRILRRKVLTRAAPDQLISPASRSRRSP